jgi:membrane fusion protein (multidrug efflux system)
MALAFGKAPLPVQGNEPQNMSDRRFFLTALLAGLLAACGSGDEGAGGFGGPGGPAPSVVGGRVGVERFSSSIEAVGTAFANEQTVLTAPVTERIERLYFTDGERVGEGAVIARLSSGEESADLAAVEARARQAQQQLERLEELQDRGFATRAQLDEQVAARDAARADASSIRSRISDRVVRAPFSGVLGLRTISEGAIVSAGEPIATLSDLSRIKLDFTVPEQFLSEIEEGQPIEAVAAAYRGEVFRGTIDSIDPVVDPMSRSVTIRAVLPNPDRRLRPGMLLTVDIVSEAREALAVPETAIIAQGQQNFVFAIDDDDIARRTAIDTGLRSDGWVEVRGGLSAGQRIVADGTVKVRDDAPVTASFPGETVSVRETGGAPAL